MNIQEVAGAKIWSDLRKQMDLIKPKKSKRPTPPRKRLKGSDIANTTARLSSAAAKLKPKSPVTPVQMGRPGKANR